MPTITGIAQRENEKKREKKRERDGIFIQYFWIVGWCENCCRILSCVVIKHTFS
jgi:hypothetical protein